MSLVWAFNVIVGLLFAVRAGKDYCTLRNRDLLHMFVGFLVYSVGSVFAGCLKEMGENNSHHVVVWIGLGSFVYFTPIYVKYLSELPGASLELGILTVLAVLLFVVKGNSVTFFHLYLPIMSMLGIGVLYFGFYEWLQSGIWVRRISQK